MDARVEVATAGHTQGLRAFFERVGSACHCQWWHFQGDKNAWLDRLAHHPQENQRAHAAHLARENISPAGLVAFDSSGSVIGWMKLTPCGDVRKLYEQRPYKNLPCLSEDRSGVLTVSCFLVAPDHRRRGVASALLRRGIEHATRIGARAIEAFPRVATTEQTLADEEAWTGPLPLFERFGFRVVESGVAAYPVLKKVLTDGSA